MQLHWSANKLAWHGTLIAVMYTHASLISVMVLLLLLQLNQSLMIDFFNLSFLCKRLCYEFERSGKHDAGGVLLSQSHTLYSATSRILFGAIFIYRRLI